MGKSRLLDLFCGAGGAAMGYAQAGFDVVGVDIAPQPRYPFEFHQADAMDYPVGIFDAIHASPPCQDYSKAMRHFTNGYPRLIEPVRERLLAAGMPYIIENVAGSPLPSQPDIFGAFGVELCGTMFGLPVWYHRLFETSFPVAAPRGCDHSRRSLNPRRGQGPGRDTEEQWREAVGVRWVGKQGGREAIPPAYTEYLGRRLLEHMQERAA